MTHGELVNMLAGVRWHGNGVGIAWVSIEPYLSAANKRRAELGTARSRIIAGIK